MPQHNGSWRRALVTRMDLLTSMTLPGSLFGEIPFLPMRLVVSIIRSRERRATRSFFPLIMVKPGQVMLPTEYCRCLPSHPGLMPFSMLMLLPQVRMGRCSRIRMTAHKRGLRTLQVCTCKDLEEVLHLRSSRSAVTSLCRMELLLINKLLSEVHGQLIQPDWVLAAPCRSIRLAS